ncbi:50S ribosomal protein L7/L12 [Candidatus Daviesbacteria bacterium]|nr:50S ribosomal protein L7/L12 [Candidatus Daviesbacteria bacterium]
MDDNQKQEEVKEEVEQAEQAAEEAQESAEQAQESAEEAKEAAEEVKTTEEVKVEAPVEEVKEEPKKASKPVSASLEKIIEQIEKLSVLELADLVHALEDRFGVSAAAPVAVTAAGAAPAAGEAAGEEQTTFNVILSSAGANKIAVIKAVRELVPTLGLKEAKDLVEAAPKPVLEGVNKENANEAKEKLTAAGGTVELQ